MELLEVAELLNAALEFNAESLRSSGARCTGQIRYGLSRIPGFRNGSADGSMTPLLKALHARLGNSPESLNKIALIRHCAEAARAQAESQGTHARGTHMYNSGLFHEPHRQAPHSRPDFR